MKVLHLCSSWFGGAAKAARRLHIGLLNEGIDSVFAIMGGEPPEEGVLVAAQGWKNYYAKWAPRLEFHASKWLHPFVRPVFIPSIFPGICRDLIKQVKPDIINLHWVEHNFITPRELKWISDQKIPMVWTMHDLSPASGGFAYREESGLQREPYGPLTFTDSRHKLSEKLMARKKQALSNAKLIAVAPSQWLANEAIKSPALEKHSVKCIPNGIDTEIFQPQDIQKIRKQWSLPLDCSILLFGADSFEHKRKGFNHLKSALEQLSNKQKKKPYLLVGFGNKTELRAEDFPVPVKGIGHVNDDNDLASLYAASDVFICPSREDNLPNTIVESLACGTPVVGFRVGGLEDLVHENETGSLAPCFDETELAQSITKVISLPDDRKKQMRENCRNLAASKLALPIQAANYISVYSELLNQVKA